MSRRGRMVGAELERFVRSHTAEVVLGDGTEVCIRPLVPSDAALITAGLAEMSDTSRRRRFFTTVRELRGDVLEALTHLDYDDEFAWVALASGRHPPGVGIASYARMRDHAEIAEAAVTVVDAFQRRGIGTLLLDALVESARARGVRSFSGYVLYENRPALVLLRRAGGSIRYDSPGVCAFDIDLSTLAEPDDQTGTRAIVRAVAREV